MRISKRRVAKMKVGVGDECGALDNDNGRRLISKKKMNKQKKEFGWVPPLILYGYLIDQCVVLTNDS